MPRQPGDKAGVILSNIDLDPHEPLALHASAVRRNRGFYLGHSRLLNFRKFCRK
jgi:hypothetical protein